MNKKITIGIIIGAVAILSMISLVQGHNGFYGSKTGMMAYGINHQDMHKKMVGMHQAMEEVMQGNYADLVAYREKVGFNMMPWVIDEETFDKAKEMHKNMGSMHQGNGMQGMMGMVGSNGNSMRGMCQ